MDDMGHIEYHVLGQIDRQGIGVPFVFRSEKYFKRIVEWCEQNIGPHRYGWYIHTTDDEYYQGNVSNIPEHIAITNAQDATVLKLAFPDVYMVHSITYGNFNNLPNPDLR